MNAKNMLRAWAISPMFSAIATCVLLVAAGCAPRAQLMVWHPAELDITGLERLAIIDFEGEQQSGKIARAALQTQLFENKYYNLIDQAELARVRPVLRDDGSPDLTAALEAGRVLGVDVLLCGQVVSYNVLDDLQTDHRIELGGSTSKSKSGNESSGVGFGLDSTQTLTREASVALAVKLIDVRTGELRAARQFAHTFNGKRVNGNGDLPARDAILTKLLNECSQDAVRMIAPHYRPQEIALARTYYGQGLKEIREGNKLATKGNWAEAEQRWQAAAKENPQSHVAHFNLAVAAEARQDYPTAQKHLETAIKSYSAVEYQAFKKRLDQDQQKFQAAMAQAQSRPTAIAARQPRVPIQQQMVQQPPPLMPQQFVQQQPVYPQQQPAFAQPPSGMQPSHPQPLPIIPGQPVVPASHSQTASQPYGR
jgi:tetratricopeptide (TPR) repeat protein